MGFQDDLANGLLGEDEANRAMSGDLTGAYRDQAARRVYQQDDTPYSQGRSTSGPPAALIIVVLAVLVLVLLAWAA